VLNAEAPTASAVDGQFSLSSSAFLTPCEPDEARACFRMPVYIVEAADCPAAEQLLLAIGRAGVLSPPLPLLSRSGAHAARHHRIVRHLGRHGRQHHLRQRFRLEQLLMHRAIGQLDGPDAGNKVENHPPWSSGSLFNRRRIVWERLPAVPYIGTQVEASPAATLLDGRRRRFHASCALPGASQRSGRKRRALNRSALVSRRVPCLRSSQSPSARYDKREAPS
jgi:hypothetical protein